MVGTAANIPNGWIRVRLGDLIKAPRPKIPPDPNSHLPFIGMDHIEARSFRLVGQDEFAKMRSAGSYFQPGDVLYGRLRPYLNKVHRAGFEGVASAEFIVFPDSPFLDGDFLKFLLHQQAFVDFAVSRSSGDRPRVKFDALAAFEFLLPPLNEQRRIAEKLESIFADLDKGEESLRHVQTLLDRYRQSVLKAAVTGELTAEWRAQRVGQLEHGRDLLARILKARRESWQGRGQYKEPVEPDAANLPVLPEGWVWCSTEQLAEVQTGATPKKGERRYYEAGRIPWITSTAVNNEVIVAPQDHITEDALRETNVKVFPQGTLIVAMYGEGQTRGKVSELGIPAATNQACAALLVAHLPDVVRRFLKSYYQFNYEAIRLRSSGGVQPNLNLGLIKRTPVPLASEEELAEIMRRIAEEMARVRDVAEFCELGMRRSKALRQAILRDAFSGKLVPQDPTDEPASQLLARIRAQRPTESRKTARRMATA